MQWHIFTRKIRTHVLHEPSDQLQTDHGRAAPFDLFVHTVLKFCFCQLMTKTGNKCKGIVVRGPPCSKASPFSLDSEALSLFERPAIVHFD